MNISLKFVGLSFLVLSSIKVFSQSSKYFVGAESGFSLSSIRSDNNSDKAALGINEALSFQYKITDLLSVKSGLGYELKRSKSIIPLEQNPVGEAKYYQNFNFLTIPVLAKATFHKKEKFFNNDFKYFANAGPYISFLLKQNSKIVATEYSAKQKNNNSAEYNKVEFGFTLGGGVSYALYKNMDLTLEIRDNIGFNNLNKNSQYYSGKVKTNAAYILVGIAIGL